MTTKTRTPSAATIEARASAKCIRLRHEIADAEKSFTTAVLKHNEKVKALREDLATAEKDLAAFVNPVAQNPDCQPMPRIEL